MSKIKDFYEKHPDYKDQRADNKIDPYAVKKEKKKDEYLNYYE